MARPQKSKRLCIAALCLALIGTLAGCIAKHSSNAEGARIAATPEFKAFLASYIDAVNSKDRKKMLQCILPAARRMMRRADFKNEFKDQIPPDVSVVVNTVAPDANLDSPLIFSLFGQHAQWTVRPTLQLDLHFHSVTVASDSTSASFSESWPTISLYCAMDGGKWYADESFIPPIVIK